MFFDEAQHLSRTEFERLRDVHDELDEGGVNLVMIFVGQPALQSKKSLFQRDGEEQIVARFMTEELRFPGLLSVQLAPSRQPYPGEGSAEKCERGRLGNGLAERLIREHRDERRGCPTGSGPRR
jgi:hypothetical protein